ncbi:MAG: glutathione peroxidase [Alphaproteobacteria bacterium]|nr:glutathione peroxidase [Alphaproteobacteria bacterium]
MLKKLYYALICVPLGLICAAKANAGDVAVEGQVAHDFSFVAISGEPLPLAQFKGKPVLIVNTASECGFTKQYAALESLHEKYASKGLVIIAVPSNDFGGQEPGSNAQIKDFCKTQFGTNFLLTEKIHVKGDNAHPFYQWARQEKGVLAAPKWNFHKYLIAPNGKIHAWFSTVTSPSSSKISVAIDELLQENVSL